ncbi:MAG: hypothetical protein B6U75_00735 [Desulfurococcales archaeon ex4484_217_1]|nr:MAG: hypothetical protein B6U75_00735 [Desulfurococcales archaeon ex4484_217_1]
MLLIFTGLNQRMQMMLWIRNIKIRLVRIERLAKDARKKVLDLLKKGGIKGDPEKFLNTYLQFFIIDPVKDEPTNLMRRLEHLLNIRQRRFKLGLKQVLPNLGEFTRANLEVMIEAARALDTIYRLVRHYLVLGEKTNNWVLIMQLELEMPQIVKLAETYHKALDAFKDGKPIGDGIGPLVAATLMNSGSSAVKRGVVEDTIVGVVERKNRKLYVIKAKGPGGTVGKPGEAVKKIVEELKGKVSRIIMIDAALKLEGEKTGEVIEGVGAAIGDPGPEKFKIESVAMEHNIPLDSIIIKESLEEALTPMRKEISDAVEKVIEKIDKALEERTKEGDVVIVVGVGNTIGIAQ